MKPQFIKDLVSVRDHPTVIRLEHLQQGDASWISHSYYRTTEVKNHLLILQRVLEKEHGCGLFLIGHYGSGKSHFLAYLSQQIQQNKFISRKRALSAISLINFRAETSLEAIVYENLGLKKHQDRRDVFSQLDQLFPDGLFLILDELSEFLRSKKNASQFNEDVRFLQFLGEWAQNKKFWILAAMQEQIEHTGELEYALYRKIKDRYPVRLLLTPVHVRNLISDSVLIKAEDYQQQVEQLTEQLQQAFPDAPLDASLLNQIYPLHPVTIELLEEVRDRFSQSRGIVEFTVNQLNGNLERQLPAFIEQTWGNLLTPDYIVDHFTDLFEIQPEFLPISQQLLPFYRKQISTLFNTEKQQQLAWKLLKLLILVYISPGRQCLQSNEAAYWLLFKVTRIDPEKNLNIINRILNTLAAQGRYIHCKNNTFALNFNDDGYDDLNHHLKREMTDIQHRGEVVFEALTPVLKNAKFSPWFSAMENWQFRQLLWHFHKRDMAIFIGDSEPPKIKQGEVMICVRLPWGEQKYSSDCTMLIPEKIAISIEIIELAAMIRISDRPLRQPAKQKLQQQILSRSRFFEVAVRTAFANAKLITENGEAITSIKFDVSSSFEHYIETTGRWLLQHYFPAFERFSPSYGALPKEAYRSFLKTVFQYDITSVSTDNYVKIIREAYLVPMQLMNRQGKDYVLAKNLGHHELVNLVMNLLDQEPSPQIIYQHLSAPVYGLLPDQVHCLLYFLLIVGEIDILKGTHSLRDHYETLIHPIAYDKIVAGSALPVEQLNSLIQLADFLKLRLPKQWTVVAQKQTIQQVKNKAALSKQKLQSLIMKLNDLEQGTGIKEKALQVIGYWNALNQSTNDIYGFQQLLYEVGSIRQFIHLLNDVSELPDKIEAIIREYQRFQHLWSQLQILETSESAKQLLNEIPEAPSLDQTDELIDWLAMVKNGYDHYQLNYKQQHDQWWSQQKNNPLLSWTPPEIANSEHIGLRSTLNTFSKSQQQAHNTICKTMSPLEFQVTCQCGFNGTEAPISIIFEKLKQLKQEIEQNLNHFFSQQKVKEHVKTYAAKQIESNPQTQLYLNGEKPVPKLTDLKLFDQHLVGIDVIKTIDPNELVELVIDKNWEVDQLIQTLTQWIQQQSSAQKINFKKTKSNESTAPLLPWIIQKALQYGQPLPSGLGKQQHQIMANMLIPEWVSEAAINNLEQLKLETPTLLKILNWLDQGHIKIPKNQTFKGYVRQISHLKNNPTLDSAENWAKHIAEAYRCHAMMVKVNSQHWLNYLNQLAHYEIPTTEIDDILQQYHHAQWLVIDAMSATILPFLKPSMKDYFPGWQLEKSGFTRITSASTTTDFYQMLTEDNYQHAFEKINCIDERIHKAFIPFEDLTNVVKAELSYSIKNTLKKLEPDQPLFIFADHGFRINQQGNRYEHGGESTAEKVVPYLYMVPGD